MLLDMGKIKDDYLLSRWKYRELSKWVFALGTFGLGGLYLWATTQVIAEGQIGLRESASGKFVLLPPGRHSFFPWESSWYPQWLSEKLITMGPYKIITVKTGEVAETYNKGDLEILIAGQHLISEASHTYKSIIPVKEETKKLDEVIVATRDNIGLTMYADVRYQIVNPEMAVSKIHDIEQSIKEIAEINIAQVVGGHSLADFAPATVGAMNIDGENAFVQVLAELTSTMKIKLEKLGISLLNIGITSWKINDETLARELGQGAVIKSQTQSKFIAATNAAQVKTIEVKAESAAIRVKAEAEAAAIGLKGRAYHAVSQVFGDDAVAANMMSIALQADMIANSTNCNLFFSPPQGTRAGLVPPLVLNHSVN